MPAILDLTGGWAGRIFAAGQFEQPIEVSTIQRVEGGALGLGGEPDLPGVRPLGLPICRFARFCESGFVLVLQTSQGFEP